MDKFRSFRKNKTALAGKTGDDRYLKFVKSKISLVVDIYDFSNYPANYYNRKNRLDLKKISPL